MAKIQYHEDMKRKIIAACGNDCAMCPRYIGKGYEKSADQLHQTAKLWMKIGYRDHVVSNEEIACTGCKKENWCRYKIVDCTDAHHVDHCGHCEKYPCSKILDCFKATETFLPSVKNVCTEEEYNQLFAAFFEKKKNLEE